MANKRKTSLPSLKSDPVSVKAEERAFQAMAALLASVWWRLEPIYRIKLQTASGYTQKQMSGPMQVHITHDVADPLLRQFVVSILGIFDASARRARVRLGQQDIADWDIRNVSVYDQIKNHEIRLATSTIEDMQAATAEEAQRLVKEMQQDLLEGQKAGDTLKDKTDRLAKYFGEMARWKARRIAITESARGQNYGFLAGTADMDTVAGYRWMLSADACDRCQAVGTVNGRPRLVKKGQPFGTGQSDEPYYATVQCPPLHPGCRCSVSAVIDLEAPNKWDDTVNGT